MHTLTGISLTMKFFNNLTKTFEGRDDAIKAVHLALLLRQHVLFYGEHGTAKTLLAKKCLQISGVSVFYSEMDKYMSPDDLYGPMLIDKYKEGIVEYNTEGMLPECEYAVLDELFDANSAVLRTLLPILNERVFNNGGVDKKVPLKTVVATSNFYRGEEEYSAIADRFLFHVRFDSLMPKGGFLDIWKKRKRKYLRNSIPNKVLIDARKNIRSVQVPTKVLNKYNDLLINLCEWFNISDRRAVWAVDILKASAYIDGREKVELKDIKEARYGLVAVGEYDETFFIAAHRAGLKE